MSDIGFEFLSNPQEMWDGFNIAEIEHFSGDPLKHLGREVPQNSLDASIGGPVKIKFKLIDVQIDDFPDLSQINQTVNYCLDALREGDEKNPKAISFFNRALELLGEKTFKVLQITDSNTLGVRGPCKPGTPFYAMMKARGVSEKSENSTGSFGIGKFAPFTVSELRTVFVSTVWSDEKNQKHHYVQGKAAFMSHRDREKNMYHGTGFWGERKGIKPATSRAAVSRWLQIPESHGTGTMISILAFQEANDWEHQLIANILQNFFGAIFLKGLEIDLGDLYSIRAGNIRSLLQDPKIKESLDKNADTKNRHLEIGSYLDALECGEEVYCKTTEIRHIGSCSLNIIVQDGLPKSVAFLRNGMLITERLKFLKRFPDMKDFIAVFQCHSERGQSLLRAMEPPRHDAFEPNRLRSEQREIGEEVIKLIGIWVRKMLSLHAKNLVSDETDIDELAEYFPDEGDGDFDKDAEENPNGKVIIRSMRTKPRKSTNFHPSGVVTLSNEAESEDWENGDVGGREDGVDSADPKNSKRGGKSNSSGGTRPQSISDKHGIALTNFRSVIVDSKTRSIYFTAPKNGLYNIKVQDSGADSNTPLNIIGSTLGTAESGILENLELKSGKRYNIEIKLNNAFLGTMRIVANAV